MSQTQFVVLLITAIVSISGFVLGIINLVLAFKNRRNSLREKVYDKHLDLFLKFNEYTAIIESTMSELKQEYSDNKLLLQVLLDKIQEMDFLINKNEIIIPDKLYKPINDFIDYMYNTYAKIVEDTNCFNKTLSTKIEAKIINLHFGINEYLGLEKLSVENMRLSRER